MKNTAMGVDYADTRMSDTQLENYVSIAYLGNGDMGDDYESDGQGSGMVRYGRWIYYWDDQGFVNLVRYESVAKAQEVWAEVVQAHYYTECERCGLSVHADEDSFYEHDRYECAPWTSVEDLPAYWPEFPHFEMADTPGVAFRVYAIGTSPKTEGEIQARMVGDDRIHTFELGVDDIRVLDDGEWCAECGQVGCTHDGRGE